MKYIRFQTDDGPRWGVAEGDKVRVLDRPPYEALCYTGETLELGSCRLLEPVEPTKIVCVGKNYYGTTNATRCG